jgi:hypothetical protein
MRQLDVDSGGLPLVLRLLVDPLAVPEELLELAL